MGVLEDLSIMSVSMAELILAALYLLVVWMFLNSLKKFYEKKSILYVSIATVLISTFVLVVFYLGAGLVGFLGAMILVAGTLIVFIHYLTREVAPKPVLESESKLIPVSEVGPEQETETKSDPHTGSDTSAGCV